MLFDSKLIEVLAGISSPGIAIAICDRNRVLWQYAGGSSESDGKIPVDFDTLFHIGSVTRAFTGHAILILRDEGLLALDEPLEHTVPESAFSAAGAVGVSGSVRCVGGLRNDAGVGAGMRRGAW